MTRDPLQPLVDEYVRRVKAHEKRDSFFERVLKPARTAQLRKALRIRKRRRAA